MPLRASRKQAANMSEYQTILVDASDSGVTTITFNRPKSRNALNRLCRLETIDAIRAANCDKAVRVVVLAGNGDGFCAGADLTEESPGMAEDGWGTRQLRYEYNPIIEGILSAEKPFIAAVNGAAAGFGASIALACDFTVMAEDAYLYSAFGGIGLTADGGLHKMLSEYVGQKKAYEMIALSQKLSAQQCEHYGMANAVVPAQVLMAKAQELAQQVAAAAPLTLRYSKLLLKESKTSSVEQIAEREAQLQNYCIRSKDFAEGMAAFFEKRPAKFTGE